jgi:PDZ domain
MKIVTHLFLLSLLLLGSSCGFARGQHQLLTTANLIQAKTLKNASDVQVFHGEARPKFGCVKTATVVANGNGYATQDDLVDTLKQETVRVGADVVIVASSGHTSMQVGTYGGGIALAQQIEYPYLTGVACRTGSIWHGIRLAPDKIPQWIVRYVYEGSPANKAGIHEGDEIVTVNGIFLGDDPTAWDRYVNAKSAQTAVSLQFVRQGIKQTVHMILETP